MTRRLIKQPAINHQLELCHACKLSFSVQLGSQRPAGGKIGSSYVNVDVDLVGVVNDDVTGDVEYT